MAWLRAGVALMRIAAVTAVLMPLQWLAVRFDWKLAGRIPVLFHRAVLSALGVRVHVRGRPVASGPVLMTANHVSWLDIPVLSAIVPVSFVAKAEVAGWPLIGTFARLQRTVFVDRTRRTDTARTARRIAERIGRGEAMVLFAEGTSSDGNRVLPFRSALVGAAHAAMRDEEVLVQPVAIAYTRLAGMPMGRQFRPRAAWYGDMELAPHLAWILGRGTFDVEVTFCTPIGVDSVADRKSLARRAETAVRAAVAAALTGRARAPGDAGEEAAVEAAPTGAILKPADSR